MLNFGNWKIIQSRSIWGTVGLFRLLAGSHMCFNAVLLKLRRFFECYIANWTHIFLRISTDAHMQFVMGHHIVTLCKRFTTLRTFVVLLSGLKLQSIDCLAWCW